MVGENHGGAARLASPCPPPGLTALARVCTSDFGDSRRMALADEECLQKPGRSAWNIRCGVEKRVRK